MRKKGPHADCHAIERTMYNAVLPGLSLDGTHFFYTNPLLRRPRPGASGAERRLDGGTRELVQLVGYRLRHDSPGRRETPYTDGHGVPDGLDMRPVRIATVPYFAWANRSPGSMRVWLPLRPVALPRRGGRE